MLARTRVGFGGSPERIFVFATPAIQQRWYDVQSIRHCEHRETIIIDATGGVGTYTVAPNCTGTLSITDGPSFNLYVGPGAQKLWFSQIAGGAGSGAGIGVGTATRKSSSAAATRFAEYRVRCVPSAPKPELWHVGTDAALDTGSAAIRASKKSSPPFASK